MRKITSLVPVSLAPGYDTALALADDGTAWLFSINAEAQLMGWKPLPPLPEGEVVFTPAEKEDG